jgi:hypothetical protein
MRLLGAVLNTHPTFNGIEDLSPSLFLSYLLPHNVLHVALMPFGVSFDLTSPS